MSDIHVDDYRKSGRCCAVITKLINHDQNHWLKALFTIS